MTGKPGATECPKVVRARRGRSCHSCESYAEVVHARRGGGRRSRVLREGRAREARQAVSLRVRKGAVEASPRLPCAAQTGVAPRNSLLSLRSFRSDRRGESEVRSALRAPTPVLRCSAPPTHPARHRLPRLSTTAVCGEGLDAGGKLVDTVMHACASGSLPPPLRGGRRRGQRNAASRRRSDARLRARGYVGEGVASTPFQPKSKTCPRMKHIAPPGHYGRSRGSALRPFSAASTPSATRRWRRREAQGLGPRAQRASYF